MQTNAMSKLLDMQRELSMYTEKIAVGYHKYLFDTFKICYQGRYNDFFSNVCQNESGSFHTFASTFALASAVMHLLKF